MSDISLIMTKPLLSELNDHVSAEEVRVGLVLTVIDEQSLLLLESLQTLLPFIAGWVAFDVPKHLHNAVSASLEPSRGKCFESSASAPVIQTWAVESKLHWLFNIPSGYQLFYPAFWDLRYSLHTNCSGYYLYLRDPLGFSRWSCQIVSAQSGLSLDSKTNSWGLDGAEDVLGWIQNFSLNYDAACAKRTAAHTLVSMGDISDQGLFSTAHAYALLGDQGAAYSYFQQLLTVEGGSIQEQWYALMWLAEQSATQGELNEKAFNYYNRAFELWPERAEPLIPLAKHYRLNGQYEHAGQLLEVAEEIKLPKDAFFFRDNAYSTLRQLEQLECAVQNESHSNTLSLTKNLLDRALSSKDYDRVHECLNAAYLKLNPVLPLNSNYKNQFLIIVPFHNASEYLQRCVDSIRQQDYKHYCVVLIDDASEDGAMGQLQLDGLSAYRIVHNSSRNEALANQHMALMNYAEPQDIAVFLDGDDWFAHETVLSTLNEIYNQTDCWVTYGQSRRSGDNGYGYARPISADDELTALFRNGGLKFPIHLRTHRAGLFQCIADQDPGFNCLKNESGGFLRHASDVAHMRAVMLLAGRERVRYIPEVLYIYNTENSQSHFRNSRHGLVLDANHIAQLPELQRVDSYCPQSKVTPRATSTKVMAIFLEGMDWQLTLDMMAAGEMPNISRLLPVKQRLGVTQGMGNDTFWRAVVSGKLPGEHPAYYRTALCPNSAHYRTAWEETWIGAVDGFWNELAISGLRQAILNVPENKLYSLPNLTFMCDFLVHAAFGTPHSAPSELIEKAGEHVENYAQLNGSIDALEYALAEDVTPILEKVLTRQQAKANTYKQLLKQGGWDVFACTFDASHDIGHKLWCYHDKPVQGVDDPVRLAYKDTDRVIGELLEGQAHVPTMLVAGLGMQVDSNLDATLDLILRELELVYGGDGLGLTRHQRPFFYVYANTNSSAVRINLAGRDPYGFVEVSEYEQLCERLIEDISELRTLNGRKVVRSVVRAKETYSGVYNHILPDLWVVWEKEMSQVEWVESSKVGRIQRQHDVNNPLSFRTGGHNASAGIMLNQVAADQVSLADDLHCKEVADLIRELVHR